MTLHGIYQILHNMYGHRGWWPADTADEIVIGAILTQNVSWSNVEKALATLRTNNLLTMAAINRSTAEDIAELIVPTRFYNQKAQKLKNFAEFFHRNFHCSYEEMFNVNTADLRKLFLQVKGIGCETADSILLYAGSKLQFVSDAYTVRLLGRLGFITPKCSYEELVSLVTEQIPADLDLYKDMHAQIVHLCANICRAKPLCSVCPLYNVCKLTIVYTSNNIRIIG